MARNNQVSQKIYRRHIRLYRYLNDAWIFADLLSPHLKLRAKELRASGFKGKKRYSVPKENRTIESRRTDADIGQLYQAQLERGIFETNIVNIVSRTEAFLLECLNIAIAEYPKKLTVLADRAGIPVDLFLEHEDREIVLERYIASRCEALMFSKPKDYLDIFQKVLAISLKDELLLEYIEIKASRDIIVHNVGEINKLYIDKAGKPPSGKARGAEGDELVIDKAYFKRVVTTVKKLSGAIQRESERIYK
jgi:hypothetical protein